MRQLPAIIAAASIALGISACGREPADRVPPPPAGYGGGPTQEHVGSAEHGTFDHGAKPAPVGSAAHTLPGLAPFGEATEANGGSGAGAVGTKGEGESLHNGLNGDGSQRRPPMEQKQVDMMPGDLRPATPDR